MDPLNMWQCTSGGGFGGPGPGGGGGAGPFTGSPSTHKRTSAPPEVHCHMFKEHTKDRLQAYAPIMTAACSRRIWQWIVET